MTEEEAKTKWCPFAREAAFQRTYRDNDPQNAIAVNRDSDAVTNGPSARCLGSGCMAWRDRAIGIKEALKPFDQQKRDGWCGLTGDRT